jgi:hypothetical protein
MRRFLCILPVLLLGVGSAMAANVTNVANVSGRYLDSGSSDIRLQLTVERPAPAAFIVIQKIPRGTQLLAAAPPPSSGAGPVIKWLFKRPRPGSFLVRMQFSQPVSVHQMEGTISYRHPGNGSPVLTRIGE